MRGDFDSYINMMKNLIDINNKGKGTHLSLMGLDLDYRELTSPSLSLFLPPTCLLSLSHTHARTHTRMHHPPPRRHRHHGLPFINIIGNLFSPFSPSLLPFLPACLMHSLCWKPAVLLTLCDGLPTTIAWMWLWFVLAQTLQALASTLHGFLSIE